MQYDDRSTGFAHYDREGVWTGAAAGTVMGVLGGIVLLSVPMFASYLSDSGAFAPLRLAASLGRHIPADPTTAETFAGFVLTMGVCIFCGALYGALCNRQGSTGGAIPFGALYGVAIYMGLTYAVLPVANPLFFDEVHGRPGIWMLAAALYGFVVGFAPIYAVNVRRHVANFRASHPPGDQRTHRLLVRRDEQV